MPFFRRLPAARGNYYVALDIGTEFVKALVCSAEGAKGRVLGVGRKRQRLGDMQWLS